MRNKILLVLALLVLCLPQESKAEGNIELKIIEDNQGAYYVGHDAGYKLNVKLNRPARDFKSIYVTLDLSIAFDYESAKLESSVLEPRALNVSVNQDKEGNNRYVNLALYGLDRYGDVREFNIYLRGRINEKKVDGDKLKTRIVSHYQLQDGSTNVLTEQIHISEKPISRETPPPQENQSQINGTGDTRFTGTRQDSTDHKPYMTGYPGDTRFKPNNPITRAEISAILSRIIAGGEVGNKRSSFRDVEDFRWYADYVGYMREQGLISGYPDGTFKPRDNITRAELAAIISKLNNLSNPTEISYPDVKTQYWARDAIKNVVNTGIMTGYPDNTFRPNNNVTRAEAATIINRARGRKPNRAFIDANNITGFADIKNHWAYYDIVEATYNP